MKERRLRPRPQRKSMVYLRIDVFDSFFYDCNNIRQQEKGKQMKEIKGKEKKDGTAWKVEIL